MAHGKWIGTLVIALASAVWEAPAAKAAADGYTLDDVKLKSASELLDICTVPPANEHHDTALAFCYGFFEGAIRYHQAIAEPQPGKKLVCAPEGTTRRQAVDVFTNYLQANPQYGNEATVDAIFRALMARWPCPE